MSLFGPEYRKSDEKEQEETDESCREIRSCKNVVWFYTECKNKGAQSKNSIHHGFLRLRVIPIFLSSVYHIPLVLIESLEFLVIAGVRGD